MSKSEQGEIQIHKWQVALFGSGVWLFGWGVASLLPAQWRRWGLVYMLASTPIMALIGIGLTWRLPA